MTRAGLWLVWAGCTPVADQEYRDPAGRFVLKHPAAFEPQPERGQVVFARSEEPSVTVTVASAARKDKLRKTPRALASAAEAAKVMLATLDQAEVGAARTATVGGKPAQVFDVAFARPNGLYRRTQWLVEGPHDLGFLALTAPTEKFESATTVAEAMLATFQLNGGAP